MTDKGGVGDLSNEELVRRMNEEAKKPEPNQFFIESATDYLLDQGEVVFVSFPGEGRINYALSDAEENNDE
ncbi:MAG: hypothetical protein UT24_C0011G0003 [Candidatus Woesebacteria bacterium GW2011_GWB1_39_12]|uniref:Uncharacterized protein n=1 Tax=Candidatus Woesebacteria bacterium GW2011_GWB1_39_12 TaxID=1618574 RepID=A0A0G0PQW7_9BACT|nr:MAG: hypothetical protein UT24_C0011G0003 [Candidatus Woesebacteria bacterium GW2011_GWB1_39_12]